MIGKKLKEYRRNLKLTGETLANLAGIQRSYLSQIENEKKIPPFDTFMNLVDAIAKILPINDENASEILTEEVYQDFKSLLEIEKSELKKEYLNYDFEKKKKNYSERKGVYVTANSEADMGKNWRVYYDMDPIDIAFVPEDKLDKIDEIIDKKLRKLFFDNYKGGQEYSFVTPWNLTVLDNEWYSPIFIYGLDFVAQSLYEWWYNHILKDFYDTFGANLEVSPEELVIYSALLSIMNPDETFTPYSSDDTINIPKSLLNKKTVTFDIGYIKDKNLKLNLDGKLLSNVEIDMLDVSLSAIRYKREKF